MSCGVYASSLTSVPRAYTSSTRPLASKPSHDEKCCTNRVSVSRGTHSLTHTLATHLISAKHWRIVARQEQRRLELPANGACDRRRSGGRRVIRLRHLELQNLGHLELAGRERGIGRVGHVELEQMQGRSRSSQIKPDDQRRNARVEGHGSEALRTPRRTGMISEHRERVERECVCVELEASYVLGSR